MKQENTICHKITQSIDDIEEAVKTGHLDIIGLSKRLHEMRESAQSMENGLKLRKQVMSTVSGLEEEYQKLKQDNSKSEGINNISGKEEKHYNERIKFEFIIKQEGKLIYQQEAYAGVVCIVEKIEDIDRFGEISGKTQKFTFGHDLSVWFAFDQLAQAIEARKVAIAIAIKEAIENNRFADPETKKKIIDNANLIKKHYEKTI